MPTTNRTPVKSLTPLDILYAFAASAIGARAEPPRTELVAALKAGRQPYPVEVVGSVVLFGLEMLSAAREAGVTAVEVRECNGREALNPADYGLKAAGLYLRAALRRLQPDPFEADLVKARAYEVWVQNMERKRPQRRPDGELKRQREEVRKGLIEQEFDCAVRTLQRHVIVSHLPPELRDAVRHKLLPVRAVTTALENLPAAEQQELAARLAGGVAFAEVEEEYFGASDTGKKTAAGKSRAILAAIATVVEEGRALAGRFALRPEDCPNAREAINLLSKWVAKPVLSDALDVAVRELSAEFGRGTSTGTKTAAHGGRGAKGDRA